MRYSDQSYNLRIELDTKNCTCSAEEIERMEGALDTLARVTQQFPVSDLYVTVIHHARTGDYHVKTSLVLSGRTLFTGERHAEMYTAYELCLDKLLKKITAYKDHLEREPERSKSEKGTHQEIIPTQLPDHDEIQRAVVERDYVRFREATFIYEEPVRKRVGRWIQRYPDLNQLIGERLEINDLVEGVFLTAFEEFERKPSEVPPGDWLEGLIEREVHELIWHPDAELENISLARSAIESEAAVQAAPGPAPEADRK